MMLFRLAWGLGFGQIVWLVKQIDVGRDNNFRNIIFNLVKPSEFNSARFAGEKLAYNGLVNADGITAAR